MKLIELFPKADYGFHLRFQRGSFSEFFRPTSDNERLIAERRHWLQTAPQTHAALLVEGVPLLEEAISLGIAGETFPSNEVPSLTRGEDPLTSCVSVGISWEPDFLLLRAGEEGHMDLVGGCVCF